MPSITYYQYTRLSDSLERNLMRDALSCGAPFSIVATAKSVFSGIKFVLSKVKAGVISYMDFCSEVSTLMAEVRARNGYYTSTQWENRDIRPGTGLV
ncbi:MAG: hypothetical protein EPN46_05645 [Candidimonas sp.]|nr:MAG: hypothetical protein EPN77_04690 [Candidimonas sp.]TAM23370.1 MAG: hypothetical protein EPN62_09675 [Candidimonas sp.]TAM77827.1 MAG: hypothetical protein EPN46_05645 [Candidimonas sp.]